MRYQLGRCVAIPDRQLIGCESEPAAIASPHPGTYQANYLVVNIKAARRVAVALMRVAEQEPGHVDPHPFGWIDTPIDPGVEHTFD